MPFSGREGEGTFLNLLNQIVSDQKRWASVSRTLLSAVLKSRVNSSGESCSAACSSLLVAQTLYSQCC